MSASTADHLLRGIALGGGVKFVVARTTDIARGLRDAHDAGPLGALALSRAATGALLLAAGLKHKQQLGVQLNGAGPLGEIYAVADADGHVRATVADPKAAVGDSLELADGVGPGRLTITRKLDEDAPAYRGVTEIVDGGVARDLAHYLLNSEQIPSALSLGERLGPEGLVAAGGFLVQALPDADLEQIDKVIARIERLPPIGELLADGLSLEGLLDRLFDDAEVLARTDLKLRCTCSREHYARKLVTLGSAELGRLTEALEETVVECHFCRTRYIFDREQMNALMYGARMYEQAD